jgi:RNA polymerase sigma-70 factor (ECF subfamily)
MTAAGDQQPSDEALMARCQTGDYEAFEALYERYHRPIIAFVFQMTRHADDAACITQSAFMKLFEHRTSFDAKRSFRAWFYRVARNATLDYLAKHRKRGHYFFTDFERMSRYEDDDRSFQPEDDQPAVAHVLQSSEAAEHLRTALERLPAMYQEIVDLIAFRDMSYEEASQLLGGTSLGTLRSRMYHALRRLRKELTDIAGQDGTQLLNE